MANGNIGNPEKKDSVSKYHYTKYKKKDPITYTDQEKIELGLDVAALANPVPDFIHAGLKYKQGKYSDAALYAGFGLLPGTAKPLVEGTKRGFFALLEKYPRIAKLFNSNTEGLTTTAKKSFNIKQAIQDQKLLSAPEMQVRYGTESLEDLFKAIDTESGKFLRTGEEVPRNLTFFGPKKRAGTYNSPSLNKYEAYLNPKKPYITDKKEIWTVDRIRGLQKEGYDMIKVKDPYIGELESIPLDKSIINMQSHNLKVKKYGDPNAKIWETPKTYSDFKFQLDKATKQHQEKFAQMASDMPSFSTGQLDPKKIKNLGTSDSGQTIYEVTFPNGMKQKFWASTGRGQKPVRLSERNDHLNAESSKGYFGPVMGNMDTSAKIFSRRNKLGKIVKEGGSDSWFLKGEGWERGYGFMMIEDTQIWLKSLNDAGKLPKFKK
tara:strand:+ start:513 stop:1814 length:1302 start_codon:yes stop_codon:yes gene_type:complete